MMRGEIAARKLLRYLEEQGLKYPSPMVRICTNLKIPVCFAPLDPFDGCYIRNKANKRLVILINSSTTTLRQFFSIAHELGHIALKHPPVAFLDNRPVEQCDPWHEVEANAFAAELLMPKHILRPMGPMTAKELARYCHVSLEAATIRVKQLGWA